VPTSTGIDEEVENRARDAASAPPSRLTTAAVAIVVCGHRQFAATPSSANSAAQPRVSSVMPHFDSM
jgi:hypothetical protein